MAEPIYGGVAFEAAIRFFRRKLLVSTKAWTDLWEGMHAPAFSIAGAQKEALLADFFAAIAKALEDGTTLQDFRKDFDRIVAEHGWSYRGSRGWRSRLIFQMNIRMATAAGRWQEIQRLKEARPYLRYVTADDNHVREAHRAWHGLVLRVDDPWWTTHYPPNGWNCRCNVQSLSERDLIRYKLKVSPEAPEVTMVAKAIRMPDGLVRTVEVPEGIDPGFAYNVGEAGMKVEDEQ